MADEQMRYERWSDAEVQHLSRRFQEWAALEDIAHELRRSDTAVMSKICALKLRRPRRLQQWQHVKAYIKAQRAIKQAVAENRRRLVLSLLQDGRRLCAIKRETGIRKDVIAGIVYRDRNGIGASGT